MRYYYVLITVVFRHPNDAFPIYEADIYAERPAKYTYITRDKSEVGTTIVRDHTECAEFGNEVPPNPKQRNRILR
jgi:hypothetical protein